MKKCVLLLLTTMLLLSGCAAMETFETLADVFVEQTPEIRQISVELPEDAVMSVMESSVGKLYLCEDYEVTIQTFSAGNLSETVRNVSGYQLSDLTVLETAASDGASRYDFVWSCVGDSGDRIGRAAILDDGGYHYVLTAMTDAGHAAATTDAWNDLFGSFRLA